MGVGAGVRSPRVAAWHASVLCAALLHWLLFVAVPLDWPDAKGVEVPSTALACVVGVICWYVAAYV